MKNLLVLYYWSSWYNNCWITISLGIKRAKTHRISHINKISRFLKLELTLPRSERMKPAELLKLVRRSD